MKATMPQAPLIDLTDASFATDGKTLLRDITLRSDARRIAVLGRNGSGKTTLARVLSGLVAPTGGKVRIGGVEVSRDRRAALGLVGILFQNPDHQIIFPTVSEEIGFGLTQMGQDKPTVAAGVASVLARFDKAHWGDAAIHAMSQGQRQLVCLMAVLAMQPKLIILDEPFAGLDIPTALHLGRVLDGIDATLVHITHDPSSILGYEQAVWLDAGQVVQDGPAAEVSRAYEKRMIEIGGSDDLAHLTG